MKPKPLTPAESWQGVNVLDRNCGLAEYVNLHKYEEGDCFVDYCWSDGQSRRIAYSTYADANASLVSMGFIRPCPYTEAA